MRRIRIAALASIAVCALGLAPGFAGASSSISPGLAKLRTINLRKPDLSGISRRVDQGVNITSSGAVTTYQRRLQTIREEQQRLQREQLQERKFTPDAETGATLVTPHRRTGQTIEDNRIKYQVTPTATFIRKVQTLKKDGPCSGLYGQKLALCLYRQSTEKSP